LSTYGQCKVDLARWAEEFGRQRRISIAWARAFFLYGPGEHAERLVPSVARALFAGKVAEVSSGAQRRDFLHVDDLADALVALTGSPLTGAVNIGSGEAVEVRTVIDNIARICGRPELVRYGARSTPPGDPPLLVADVGRLRHELNWQPRIGLADGLKDTVSRLRLSRAA
jgi:nucleoside-diphosphate-sugar epimerase